MEKDCNTCKFELYNPDEIPCTHCGMDEREYWQPKPQTNADRIRARLEKDEELADLRICYNPDTDMYDTDAGSFTDFVSAMEAELEWLRQPAKENENE